MSLLPRAVGLLRVRSCLPAMLRPAAAHTSAAQRSASVVTAEPPAARQPTADVDAPAFDMENPYKPERRLCIGCRNGIHFDYKNVRLMSQFVSSFTGRMYGRHVTGLCAQQHRRLEREYMKAVACGHIGLMMKPVEFTRDPKICDPNDPVRSHRF